MTRKLGVWLIVAVCALMSVSAFAREDEICLN